jgi:hypothetical protein
MVTLVQEIEVPEETTTDKELRLRIVSVIVCQIDTYKCVLGAERSGKTALCQRFVTDQFSDEYKPTSSGSTQFC